MNENVQYLFDNGHTPKSAAISRVIDLINTDLEQIDPTTKQEKTFYNQLVKINNKFVEKFNSLGYGDASGGWKEEIKIWTF